MGKEKTLSDSQQSPVVHSDRLDFHDKITVYNYLCLIMLPIKSSDITMQLGIDIRSNSSNR
jgi:hypothetical protein